MARLTEARRNDDGTAMAKKDLVVREGMLKGMPSNYCYHIVDKLADYEDLEDQQLLLKLPCKVGTEVYYILGIPNKTPCCIEKTFFSLSDINKVGKTIFLTELEAEEALKEQSNRKVKE